MIGIDEVEQYLKSRLRSHVKNKTQFDKWLKALLNDEQGRVLGYNLYIDLNSEALNQKLVGKVIDRMDISHRDARERFCMSIEDERYQSEYICQHPHPAPSLDGDRYIRILPLEDMIEYYFRDPLGLSSSSTYASKSKVLKKFFHPKRDRRKGLGLIESTWRGRMLNVWVTSKQGLDELRQRTSKREFADQVGNRLGFDNLVIGDILVGIVYPINFNHLVAYIPTTLDAHVGCHFFVPFAAAGVDWGLSCCLNLDSRPKHDPDSYCFKERVHEFFEGLTDEFEGEIIGSITEDSLPDWEHLFNVAQRRANNLQLLF